MKLIPLTQGKFAMVDDGDFDWLSRFKWHPKSGEYHYPATNITTPNGGTYMAYMHRLIMDPGTGMTVDHIDRNVLNNQRYNLRVCTFSENNRNRGRRFSSRSGYVGVTWHKQTSKWQAQIGLNGKMYYLGLFDSAAEAALAYNKASIEKHGEFGVLNIINLEQP